MAVIMRSDVAKLVLGYLQEESLHDVSESFCRSSPHLKEEWGFMSQGIRTFQMNETTLMDKLREHCQIRVLVSNFVDSISEENSSFLIKERSTLERIQLILNATDKTLLMSRTDKRRNEDYTDILPTATQSKDLPGFQESYYKRPRFTDQDNYESIPSIQKTVDECKLPTIQKQTSPNQIQNILADEEQTSLFSNTILDNLDFQNVLVNNINNMMGQNANADNEPGLFNVDVEGIVAATELNPIFKEVVFDCIRSKQHNRSRSTHQESSTISDPSATNIATTSIKNRGVLEDKSEDNPQPIKQRLRSRKTSPNYVESAGKRPYRRKSAATEIQVISNESYKGEDLLASVQQEIMQQNFLVLNTSDYPAHDSIQPQNILLNYDCKNANTQNFIMEDGNIQILPMVINIDQSFLEPGSVINFIPNTIPEGVSKTSSGLINGVAQTSVSQNIREVAEPICDSRGIYTNTIPLEINPSETNIDSTTSNRGYTFPQGVTNEEISENKEDFLKSIVSDTPKEPTQQQLKAKALSTPRRNSHVRVLNFSTPANEFAEHEVVSSTQLFTNRQQLSSSVVRQINSLPFPYPELNTQRNVANMTPAYIDSHNHVIPSSAPPKLSHVAAEEDHSNTNPTPKNESEIQSFFEKDHNEATVISVDLSVSATPVSQKQTSKPRLLSQENKRNIFDGSATKKKIKTTPKRPTRVNRIKKSPNDILQTSLLNRSTELEKWQRLRSIKSSEWDNHLRQELSQNGNPRPKSKKVVLKRKKPSQSILENTKSASQVGDTIPQGKKFIKATIKKANASENKRETVAFKIGTTPSKSAKKIHSLTNKNKQTSQKNTKSNQNIGSKVNASLLCAPGSLINKTPENPAVTTETPIKGEVPPTPRLLLPTATDTPIVKLIRFNSELSAIKSQEFPSPHFPITPGATTTPTVQSNSPMFANFNSPYYRPDESSNVDIESGYENNRADRPLKNPKEFGLALPKEPIKLDSSSSSNGSTSSSSSDSSSSDSSESTSGEDGENKSKNLSLSKEVQVQATNQVFLVQAEQARIREEKRLRIIEKLKASNATERFKVQPTLSQRKGRLALKQGLSAAVAASKQKPLTHAKFRIASSYPDKNFRRTPNQRICVTKIARKVICLDSAIPTGCASNIATTNNKARRKSVNGNSTVFTSKIQAANVDAPKADKLLTSINMKAVQSIEDTSANVNNRLSDPSLPDPNTYVASYGFQEQIHDLFGTMSDSDYPETPLKKNYSYDERMAEVLPALALMPTPQKTKCLSRINIGDGVEYNTPNSFVEHTELPKSPDPHGRARQKQLDMDESSDSGETDPYDECTLAKTTTSLLNCHNVNIISDSSVNPITCPLPVESIPCFKIALDGRMVHLSVYEESVLFSNEPSMTMKSFSDSLKQPCQSDGTQQMGQPLQSSTPTDTTKFRVCSKLQKGSVLPKHIKEPKTERVAGTRQKLWTELSTDTRKPNVSTLRSLAAVDPTPHITNLDINLVLGKIHPFTNTN